MLDSMFDNTPWNTWALTGGRITQGCFEDIQGVRNYAGLFEEVIRWDMCTTDEETRQRFVVNTGRTGLSLADLDHQYDQLAGRYQPRALAVLLGTEDAALSPEKFQEHLDHCVARNKEAGVEFFLLQTPPPSQNGAENIQIEKMLQTLSNWLKKTQTPSAQTSSVQVIDHYRLFSALPSGPRSHDIYAKNAGGNILNAKGHLMLANQLLDAVCGGASKVSPENLEKKETENSRIFSPKPVLPGTPQEELARRLARPEPMDWLFMGDSITHGALHTTGYDSLPQILEKYIREEWNRPDDHFINTGVSGATTDFHMNHYEERYTRYQRSGVAVIMFGTNDAAIGPEIPVFTEHLRKMARDCRKNGTIVILRTPNKIPDDCEPRSENLPGYAEAVRKIAKEENCILADHFRTWENALNTRDLLILPFQDWQNDSIHPNAQGQLIMAQELIYEMGLWRENSAICRLAYEIPRLAANH